MSSEVFENTAIGPSPVEQILLVKRYELPRLSGPSTSRPGHLLHYFVAGEAELLVSGRVCPVKPGTLLWYYENQRIEGTVTASPLIFYSVNFLARAFPPPAVDNRLFQLRSAHVRRLFRDLTQAWNQTGSSSTLRTFQCHARLLQILACLTKPALQSFHIDAKAELWWRIESEYLKDLSTPVSLESLALAVRRTPRTIARSCHYAVGKSPMRRIRELRLDMAKGLLRQEDLTISEVAYQVGYTRVHEFSRDYHRFFGLAPSKHRPILLEKTNPPSSEPSGSKP